MNEMLKENTQPASQAASPEKIAELIDKRVSEAMSEFTKKLEEAGSPISQNNENKEVNENGNNEGNEGTGNEGGEEGASEDIDS